MIVGSKTGPGCYWQTAGLVPAGAKGPIVGVVDMTFYAFSDGWNTMVFRVYPAEKQRC